MQRASTDRNTAIAYLLAMFSDAREVARGIRAPTLIVHRKQDAISAFDAAKIGASLIPGARFVPLEGDNHWPLCDDRGAPELIRAIRDFLDEDADALAGTTATAPKSSGHRSISRR
jgi:pimeloyl-ACP methyl ester carboxylesterase